MGQVGGESVVGDTPDCLGPATILMMTVPWTTRPAAPGGATRVTACQSPGWRSIVGGRRSAFSGALKIGTAWPRSSSRTGSGSAPHTAARAAARFAASSVNSSAISTSSPTDRATNAAPARRKRSARSRSEWLRLTRPSSIRLRKRSSAKIDRSSGSPSSYCSPVRRHYACARLRIAGRARLARCPPSSLESRPRRAHRSTGSSSRRDRLRRDVHDRVPALVNRQRPHGMAQGPPAR